MVLKQQVVDAFRVLDIDPATTNVQQATTAYKKLALKHHPDRNYGDPAANERFQEIGAAWSICQRHFEYPASSQVPEPGTKGFNFTSGRTYTAEDEVPLDGFEAEEFFRFMFREMFFGRYSYSKGQRYRSQRAGAAGGGVYTFSGGFAEAQQRQAENAAKQAKEAEEYRKRIRDFEREQAEEQAEIDRLAREEAKDQARLTSAQNSAFQLGKEGKGAEMRNLIEKFGLDVTKPRKLNPKKDAKTVGKTANFETMLHVAAGLCDVYLIDWLLGRGADPSALDPSHLTPFHVAIVCGNTAVVRHLITLYRNTKSTDPRYQSLCDGCHPSKAAKDKDASTPLQLAIKSGNLDMVELLLKDATVHNVERCWAQLRQGEHHGQIGDILLTKNGFAPPGQNSVTVLQQTMSKKAIRKMKQAEEEKKAYDEKVRRLAEEEENRLKKQARREKAAKEEAERQAKREAKEKRRIQEAEEEERRRQAKQQEQDRVEAEERARREAEENARREQREAERRQEAASEAKRRLREEEVAARQKAKEALVRQREMEIAAARQAKAEAEAARFAQREAELKREEEQRLKLEMQRAKREREEQLQRENARLKAEVMARLQQEQDDAKRIQQEEASQARRDAMMRHRAEQSARDKARNQRIREERVRAQASEFVVAPPTPSTPTSENPLQLRGDQTTPTITKRIRSKRASSSTVAPPGPPPVPLHTRPKVESSYSRPPALLSPPMTPEDLQTIPIPEDLFQYEPPVPTVKYADTPSPALNASSLKVRERGVRARGIERSAKRDTPGPASISEASDPEHLGNGIMCRFLNKRGGCARGTQCAFSHVTTPRARRTDLEEELAKKNLEIERMRAELAAAKAMVSQHALRL